MNRIFSYWRVSLFDAFCVSYDTGGASLVPILFPDPASPSSSSLPQAHRHLLQELASSIASQAACRRHPPCLAAPPSSDRTPSPVHPHPDHPLTSRTNLCAYYTCEFFCLEVSERQLKFLEVREQYIHNIFLLPSIVSSVIHNICYDDWYSYWSPSL
jgi:hypothetical protein